MSIISSSRFLNNIVSDILKIAERDKKTPIIVLTAIPAKGLKINNIPRRTVPKDKANSITQDSSSPFLSHKE